MKTSLGARIRKNPKFWVGVILYIAAFAFPLVFTSPYYQNVAIISICSAILGISFLLGMRCGLINMTIPTFWGVGAYLSAAITKFTGLNNWQALPICMVISFVLALGLGYVLISSGSGGFAFVMLTQVVCMMFTVLIGNLKFLGGNTGFTVEPMADLFGITFSNNKAASYYVMLIMLGIVMLVTMCFYASWSGRAWAAIGKNARLADSIGINRFRYKLMAYVVASMLVAFCGCFYVHYKQYVYPANYSMWKNIYVQIYAIMGGTDFAIAGPVTGGAIMNILPEAMRFTETISPLITGIILILLIQYLPKGVLSLAKLPGELYHKRKAKTAAAEKKEIAGIGGSNRKAGGKQ